MKGEQSLIEPFLNVPGQRQEGALGRRLEDEAVAPHLHESRLPADLLVWDGPGFFTGGPSGLRVEAVFEVFEEFEVFNRHQRGDRLPMSFEDDALALERHAVDRVGECVADGRGRNAGHGPLCTLRTFRTQYPGDARLELSLIHI